MEIAPVPRRPPLSAVGRLVLVLAFLLPVVVLMLVPATLGLQRYVVTGDAMGGSMGRGALVYAHSVPVSDLAVGDVITFVPPGSDSGDRVTRRVVGLEAGTARTQGDDRSRPDPWTLSLDDPVQTKVLFAVPWVGYPFTGPLGGGAGIVLGIGTVALIGALGARISARRPARESRVLS